MISIVVICLLPTVLPLFGEVTSPTGTVTGDNLNMRVSPSLSSEIVGQLKKGQEVEILTTEGEWCAIVPPDRTSAWVSDRFIKDGLVTGSRVNVRSGPGVSYGRLTYLRQGAEVLVLEEQGGWVKIQIPDPARLWVSSRYIDQSPGNGLLKEDAAPKAEAPRGAVSPRREAIEIEMVGEETIVETASTSFPVVSLPAPTPVPEIISSSTDSFARIRSAPPAKSYHGYIRKLAQPFSTADREYAFELMKDRYDSHPAAYLTGDTIDLEKYLLRKVRLWAVIIENKAGSPSLMEVKGVGFLW